MSEHTPEPWALFSECMPPIIKGPEIAGHGRMIATVYGDETDNEKANARRILACVNACQGISTEYLESAVKNGSFVQKITPETGRPYSD